MVGSPRLRERQVEELFRTSYARIVAVLGASTGDAQEAAEATQEAFIKAFEGWNTVRELTDPEAWIRRVAMNRILDRRRHLVIADRVAPLLVAQSMPEAPNMDHLHAAIRRLPKQQRLAIILFYFEDLPVRDVASLLGVATGTVKSALHDARRSLSKMPEVAHDR